MKKIIITLALATIFTALTQNVFADAALWKRSNFQLLAENPGDGFIEYRVSSQGGTSCTIQSKEALGGELIKKIALFTDIVDKFQYIQVESIFIKVIDTILEAQIITKNINYQEKNYHSHVRGGILFEYSTSIQYAFRIIANDVTVKIDGYFRDETEILNKIADAVKDPKAYLRERDPHYLHSQLVDFKIEVQKMMQEKDQKMEDLRQEQAKLLQKQSEQFEKLRKAVIALANKGWFSGPKLVDDEKIQKIIALKQANPQATVEEIKKQLKEEKIEVSAKEIELVFIVFYNEIEK